MNRRKFALAALLLLAAWPAMARAEIINGGFETGDLTGWVVHTGPEGFVRTTGFESKLGEPGFYRPAQGASFAYLGAGVSFNSTSIRQRFTASAGDVLRFSVFFDADDSVRDPAFAELTDLDGVPYGRLFDFDDPFILEHPDYGRQYLGTPWRHIEYTLPVTGEYVLDFVVSNGGDYRTGPALGVDNVRVTQAPAPPALLLAGIGGAMMWAGRRFNRRRGNAVAG